VKHNVLQIRIYSCTELGGTFSIIHFKPVLCGSLWAEHGLSSGCGWQDGHRKGRVC